MDLLQIGSWNGSQFLVLLMADIRMIAEGKKVQILDIKKISLFKQFMIILELDWWTLNFLRWQQSAGVSFPVLGEWWFLPEATTCQVTVYKKLWSNSENTMPAVFKVLFSL